MTSWCSLSKPAAWTQANRSLWSRSLLSGAFFRASNGTFGQQDMSLMTELQEAKQVAVSVALDVSNTKHRRSSRSLIRVVAGCGSLWTNFFGSLEGKPKPTTSIMLMSFWYELVWLTGIVLQVLRIWWICLLHRPCLARRHSTSRDSRNAVSEWLGAMGSAPYATWRGAVEISPSNSKALGSRLALRRRSCLRWSPFADLPIKSRMVLRSMQTPRASAERVHR